jgi:hypothetical protein
LDNVTSEELCFTVSGYRASLVQDLKPTPVKVYDYYDKSELVYGQERTKSKINLSFSAKVGQSSYTGDNGEPIPVEFQVPTTTKLMRVTRRPPFVFVD